MAGKPSVWDNKAKRWTHGANIAAVSGTPNGTWANDTAVCADVKTKLNLLLAALKEAGLMVQD